MATRSSNIVGNNNTGVRVTQANLDDVLAAVLALSDSEVLVGFPEDTTQRDPEQDGKTSEDITNAAIAFIQDNGAPEVNIPARPFMVPGIKAAESEIEAFLGGAMRAAMKGNIVAAEGQMHAAGSAAKLSIQRTINSGIDPPLSDRTLRARARRGRKGAELELWRREQGGAPSSILAKPLVDTAQMRNAVNYVIRKRSARRK